MVSRSERLIDMMEEDKSCKDGKCGKCEKCKEEDSEDDEEDVVEKKDEHGDEIYHKAPIGTKPGNMFDHGNDDVEDHKSASWDKYSKKQHEKIIKSHEEKAAKFEKDRTAKVYPGMDSKSRYDAHKEVAAYHKDIVKKKVAEHSDWYNSLNYDQKRAYKKLHPNSNFK